MQLEHHLGLAIAQPLSIQPMTIPLWGLVLFILWVIAVVILLIVVRIRHLAIGGSPEDFAVVDDKNLMWRLFRVQANLIENLPLYLGIVFLLTIRGVFGGGVNLLISIYITFRLLHSIIHIVGADPRLRIASLAVQFSCLLGLIGLAIVE
ncbi:MAPEG family protein [Leptolyngbya sp. AN02str]|uniref:MAPEG family protein n=1 Tax=Leptolyngbya sp. AN02str TaxID=3423363 RepID=UPI003D317232